MRIIIALFITLLVAALVTVSLHVDNGYALLSYRGTTVEMSLATLVVLLVFGLVALYALLWFLLRMWRFPRQIRELYHHRRMQRSRRTVLRGLIDLAEGRFEESERRLTRYADTVETPLIPYLAAARAAQLRGAHERRDEYLKQAYEATPSANIAVLLTQAELQIAHRQYELALATLRRLNELNPRHAYAMKLLSRLYLALNQFEDLHDLIPRLRQYHALPANDIDALEIRTTVELMKTACSKKDADRIDALWRGLPRRLRAQEQATRGYVSALLEIGAHDTAEEILRSALRSSWDDKLVITYGQVKSKDPAKQLARIESWLEQHPDDSALLLTAGRLCIANQLWGKARSYLESSLAAQPRAETYEELGRLLQSLGEPERAMEAYRNGIDSIMGRPVKKFLPGKRGAAKLIKSE